MGLSPTDSIPRQMSPVEIYMRVWNWYRDKMGLIRQNIAAVECIQEMPKPEDATADQLKEVFGEILMNNLEWSYHHKDEYGYKMGAYAHAALGK